MGSNSTESKSTPVSPEQRAATYQQGIKNISESQNAMPWAAYEAPNRETLSGGDYNRLEQNIVTSRMAPIQSAMDRRFRDIDQSMSDRGLYTSGLPDQAKNRVMAENFLPAITQAGAEAATQRYGMQSAENQAGNTFNLENAKQKYDSDWRPKEYLQGLWNGTGGTISSSTGGGWSI